MSSTSAKRAPLPKLLTPDDLAATLGVTRKSIYNRVSRGQIPAAVIIRLGEGERALLRFEASAVTDWLTKKHGSQRE
ncbi:MAG: helix-turn-helix domain-containing protein [Myxococcales bacterium]